MEDYDIILASNSKQRKDLLKYIFNEFKIIPAKIDERKLEKDFLDSNFKDNMSRFSELCEKLSYEKCKYVSKKYNNSLIISADTIVFDNNVIFGKPKNILEARNMLEYLSGKEHIVQTSVTIFFNNIYHTFSVKSYVTFYDLDSLQKRTIESYINTDLPYDKAGGYGIQDNGNFLIRSTKGDFYNIVGLPISKLYRKIMEITNLK
ncbi:Maf family protein [Parvimonas micra]